MRKNGAKVFIAQAPASLTTNTGLVDGVTVDRLFEGGCLGPVVFTAVSGAITAGTCSLVVQESDDGSVWGNVKDDQLSPATPEVFGSTDDNKRSDLVYMGTKRYVRANRGTSAFSGVFGVVAVVVPPNRNLGLLEVLTMLPPRVGQASQNMGAPVGGAEYDSVSLLVVVGATAGTGTTAVSVWNTGSSLSSVAPTVDDQWYDGIDVGTKLDITAALDTDIVRVDAKDANATFTFLSYGVGGPTSPSMALFVGDRKHGQSSHAVRNTL